MQLLPLKKVTVIIEDAIKNQLVKKILEMGATGFTSHEVQGHGSRGLRSDPFANNVEIGVICNEPMAEAILKYVADHYLENHACIAWVDDVKVVRGDRYLKA